MLKKRGQISFEYLTIISFGLAILLVAIYLFYNYSINSNDDFLVSRIETIGNDIVHNAETLYYITGEDSSTHLELFIPENVKEIYILNSTGNVRELVIKYNSGRGSSESVFFSSVKLNGSYSFPTGPAINTKTTFFDAGEYRTGAIKLRFTNEAGGVKIEEVN